MSSDGVLTPQAELWMRKTKDLTKDDWRNGFAQLEKKVAESVREGKESWPPNYVEFVEMAKINTAHSPTGINSGAYKLLPRVDVKLIKDTNYMDKKRAKAKSELSKIRANLKGE